MYDLTFLGKDYKIEEGSIIEVEDKSTMFGDWIKICTDEFDVECSKIEHKRGITKFKVDTITERDTPVEIEEHINYNSMRKADLIDFAKNLGVEVDSKMTKAKIIEAIENK